VTSSQSQEPVHVLVADDEPHIGRIIKMKLEAGPFRVTLAYDGQQALETLARHQDVQLVLLDLMMPHLSGLDVLAAIRADPRWSKLPCIILTAAGQEAQHMRARELGVNEFLTKPFSPKRLYQRALELVGISEDSGGSIA
jgi:two-component system, OmpR family, alkaline phosphatase synthesis response regulator PhoP